jgi:hypothetical protein
VRAPPHPLRASFRARSSFGDGSSEEEAMRKVTDMIESGEDVPEPLRVPFAA